ncbi:DEKNAAC100666 [Brettanomyces naardenensis]|uniref:DEKNAAC100666 n=1 Tax=Brettanomyces naardenensis TaxID=13370 RepID=A0A448YF03_BRENA|nr:DEKNAAC100666 [Brettanomyces naardenensis]
MSFPCLEKLEKRSKKLVEEGPEPVYSKISDKNVDMYHSGEPIFLDYGGFLPEFDIAYESWGTLNADRSNAVLIHTGLSASSHAHSTKKNPTSGWWEDFIGPDRYLDTNKYFVICTNVIGGCFGSTGPMSVDPSTGEKYATSFPVISVNDMVRAQHRLISDHFSIKKLYCSIGASMGGMQSLAYANEFSDEVVKVVSISGCAKSHPYSIAMRFCQRHVLMTDPKWNKGYYYNGVPPHTGMKLAREIATITYRSGPEWEQRFGVERADPSRQPAFCPDFLIETYLDHAGEKWCLDFDPNSFLYISKAMDLFDLGKKTRSRAVKSRHQAERRFKGENISSGELVYKPSAFCEYEHPMEENHRTRRFTPEQSKEDLVEGLSRIADKEVLVVGVESDILFPAWQQMEIFNLLREAEARKGADGSNIHHVELSKEDSYYGHDTFLLALKYVGDPVKAFLG